MTALATAARRAADRSLRRALERLHRSSPALVPEYPLELSARWGWGEPGPLSWLEERFAAERAAYVETIESVCEMLEWALTVPRHPAPPEPGWENDWWGTVDALVQCAELRRRDPPVYLEIGSGHSTLFARRAISDFGLRSRVVCVDPAPRADVAGVCDELIRAPLQRAVSPVLERLEAGGVVLLDGSHVALMGTDATVFLLEILPRLPAGVLVAIDDVFLPWDYPPQWRERIYGEQYLLAAFLLGGAAGFSVRFPAWWVCHRPELADRLAALWPVVENRFGRAGASLWLERDAGR